MVNHNSYGADATAGITNTQRVIQSVVDSIENATVVRVVSVKAGGTGEVGFVDVQPLIQQLSADGKAHSAPLVKNLPYFRLQGGQNAVIIDPQVGDLGLAVIASRDISGVKREKTEVPPSTLRKYDISDGLYIGGFLNGAPQQYIHFKDDGGIKVVATGDYEVEAEGDIKMTAKGLMRLQSDGTMTLNDPSTITLDTPSTMITGGMTGGTGAGRARSGFTAMFNIPVVFNQLATFKNDADFNGINFSTHKHGGVLAGGADTDKPTG